MRKFLFAVAAVLFFSSSALAQRTVVSGTVKDINSVPYAGATLVVTLSTPSGFSGAYLNGVQITGSTQRVTLDNTGSFLMQLPDNNVVQCSNAAGQIVTCVPLTQWTFAVNISPGAPPPLGTGPQNCTAILTITGASQSVTSSFSACPALSAALVQTPGLLPTQLIQSGLIADYRILPSENPCALIDYSNNSNNATGCVGTSPVIQTNTGGVQFNGTGAISLPAALNSAQTVMLFVNNINANGGWLAGNGTPANSSILLSTVFTQSATQTTGDSSLQHNSRVLAGSLGGGSNIYTYPRAVTSGNLVITWDAICDAIHLTEDTILINNVDMASFATAALNGYVSQACSQGHQTVGNYQLGGVSTCVNYTGCGLINNGIVYWATFYNRALTIQEVQQNVGFMTSVMSTTRSVQATPFKGLGVPNSGNFGLSIAAFSNLAIDGDSLSCGPCAAATPNPVAPYSSYIFAGLTPFGTGSWNISNMARVGFTLAGQLLPFAPIAIDPIFEPNTIANVVVPWAGTNDGATNPIPQLQAYCLARKAVGWKVLPVTMISRTGFDAKKNTYNASIRQLWPTFADGLIDLASDPNLGADGANASAVYFANDHVHVQDVGIINDETPWIQRAVNRLYGNHDFTTATVYSSAAAAPVATTAGSQSTNTVTITTAATPANCQINNFVQVAGVTPAGYNGNWFIRTRTATQLAYFDANTGLGAITVQGTISCPQRQDPDHYAVLNFGAGNHTLDSCQGYTGQNIYTKNINAAASTMVPFQASETIDGAANLAIASNQVRILQAQLVSPSALGCTWKVIQ